MGGMKYLAKKLLTKYKITSSYSHHFCTGLDQRAFKTMATEEELIKINVHDKLVESGEFER